MERKLVPVGLTVLVLLASAVYADMGGYGMMGYGRYGVAPGYGATDNYTIWYPMMGGWYYNYTNYTTRYPYETPGGYDYPYGGMMGGYGHSSMHGSGMMGYGWGVPYGMHGMMGTPYGGMMGYALFGAPWTYGYGSNLLFWAAVIVLVAIAAYVLGRRSKTSGG